MQDEATLDFPNLNAFQNKSQVECFCVLCSCNYKDELKNKFSVLNLGCCLWFHGFPQRNECEQIQDTNHQAFFQRGKVRKFQRGELCSLLMVNAEK